MRITEKQYNEALKIVLDYKEQLIKEIDYIESVIIGYGEYRDLPLIGEISMRAFNCLRSAGVLNSWDAKVIDLKGLDIKSIKVFGFGDRSKLEVKKVMEKAGFTY